MKYLYVALCTVFLIEQGQTTAKRDNQFSCHCNCGKNTQVLISMIKSVLRTCAAGKPGNPLPGSCPKVPKNCAELLKCGVKKSGVYEVDPDGKGKFKVYCDQKTNGGGWAVFQRRQDGSQNFYRGWNDYKKGFGDLKGEFWLGLDNIHRLTQQVKSRLRVDIADVKGKTAYADYSHFTVASERAKYKLGIGTYSGTAGDSLSYHNNMAFSTKDKDNDRSGGNCAISLRGAWWFNSCHYSNLNGLYQYHGTNNHHGVNWYYWKKTYYSLPKSEMKTRPA